MLKNSYRRFPKSSHIFEIAIRFSKFFASKQILNPEDENGQGWSVLNLYFLLFFNFSFYFLN